MAAGVDQIKELREKTGAGVTDVKRALEEASGDFALAMKKLRERGVKVSQNRAARSAQEGWIGSYVHQTGKVGVLVELRCETDFVARSGPFQALLKALALHVAAANPIYRSVEDIPQEVMVQEKEIARNLAESEGKAGSMVDKIVAGKLQKWYTEVCLLSQPFIKDETKTITDLFAEAQAQLGEKIEVGRFVRFQI